MTTLKDVLSKLDRYPHEQTLYVPKHVMKVDLDTEVVLRVDLDAADAEPGYRYFLELVLVAEVLEHLQETIGGKATLTQKAAAVAYYAENDAYPDVDRLRALP